MVSKGKLGRVFLVLSIQARGSALFSLLMVP